MNFTADECERIIAGTMTQVRIRVEQHDELRPSKKHDRAMGVYPWGHQKARWVVGKLHLVKADFGEPPVARIRITDIRREDDDWVIDFVLHDAAQPPSRGDGSARAKGGA